MNVAELKTEGKGKSFVAAEVIIIFLLSDEDQSRLCDARVAYKFSLVRRGEIEIQHD